VKRRALLAAIAGLGFAGALVAAFAPGAHDLWSRAATGLEAPDDGYWSAPTRRLAGAGDQDAYDHDLAVALALPQNALAATAVALGVPYPHARFAGSLLAAAVLAGLVGLAVSGRARVAGGVGLAFLATPPVLGHLVSDLGEGTALGFTALWAVAALGRRWFLAGLLAAVALSQKASGLALGLGTLVGVLGSAQRRVDLPRAALGVAAGLASAVAIAVFVFQDAPLAFLTRPYLATADTQSGTKGVAVVVQAAFLGHHGVGRWLLPGFGAALVAAVFAGPRRPSVAVVAATAAACLFAGAFPDPWRVLPALPLLAATLVDTAPPPGTGTRGPARATRGSVAPALLALPQAVGGAAAWVGPSSALVLLGLCAAAAAMLVVLRRYGPRPRWALAITVIATATGLASSGWVVSRRTDERRDLAREVASRVPREAPLIGYSFLASAYRGTLYYPPFHLLWAREVAARPPPALYRLRVLTSEEEAPPPGPAGYAVVERVALGDRLYNREEFRRPLVLETLRPSR